MPKREEAWSFSKKERQKMQKLYIQDGAACGPVRIIVKTTNLPVSKVRQFSQPKPSFSYFFLATRKFKKMKALARFKNELWCLA